MRNAAGSTRSSTVDGGISAQSSAECGNEEDEPAGKEMILYPLQNYKQTRSTVILDLVCLDVKII